MKLSELNQKRNNDYRKDEKTESFVERFNHELKPLNSDLLQVPDSELLQIFVVGNPRSGTTITTQLISQGLEVGYINNLAARFWLTPMVGLEFSKAVFGDKRESSFTSEFATTTSLLDIHEFGYFWREHLNLQSTEDIIERDFSSNRIDWGNLRSVLLNMQAHFNRPMVFKNIFGAYNMVEFTKRMPRTLWVYVSRDPFDNAMGILRARKKFYDNPETWWSTIPMEYHTLKEEDVYTQVAGQTYYLDKFYTEQMNELDTKNTFHIHYPDLCSSPGTFISRLRDHINKHFDLSINTTTSVPRALDPRTYDHSGQEADRIKKSLSKYATRE